MRSILGRWNTIAVKVVDGNMTPYVDDRRVFTDYRGTSAGRLDFAALDIGSGYTDQGTCMFRHAYFRAV